MPKKQANGAWTGAEDDKLKQLIAADTDMKRIGYWTDVAKKMLTKRDGHACSVRWYDVLNPKCKRTAWEDGEAKKLGKLLLDAKKAGKKLTAKVAYPEFATADGMYRSYNYIARKIIALEKNPDGLTASGLVVAQTAAADAERLEQEAKRLKRSSPPPTADELYDYERELQVKAALIFAKSRGLGSSSAELLLVLDDGMKEAVTLSRGAGQLLMRYCRSTAPPLKLFGVCVEEHALRSDVAAELLAFPGETVVALSKSHQRYVFEVVATEGGTSATEQQTPSAMLAELLGLPHMFYDNATKTTAKISHEFMRRA